MTRKVEIFRAGKQTDSAGNERDWTIADLDKIASSYNPEYHEAPVCIGHPKDNAPAWAWVKKVTREGQSLFAEIGDEAPEFSDWLEAKRFKKRSISLYQDMRLRHLAFLGAQPPAVKGLKDFADADKRLAYAFADADKGEPITLDFADWSTVWSFHSLGRLFQGLREHFIASKDVETADRLLPQHEIDALKAMQADPEKPSHYQESEMTQQEHDTAIAAERAKTEAAEAKANQFSEQLATERAKAAELETQLTAIKTAAQDKELADFCEGLRKEGKILPGNIPGAIAVMKAMASQPEMDFAEGNKTVKKTPLAIYQEQLKAGPKVIQFGEVATKDNSQAANPDDALTAKTKAKMAANPGMSFAEAGRAVLAEDPSLNTAFEAA